MIEEKEVRNQEIRELRRGGMKLENIAVVYGITRERVRQLTLDIPRPPKKIKPTKPSFEERFWNRVQKSTPEDCWIWLSTCHNVLGYGIIKRKKNRSNVYAHRVAWEFTNGEIPDKMVVRHTCDNRKCCNPAHLVLGTQLENIQDREARYNGKPRGIKKLNYYLAEKIREQHKQGETYLSLSMTYHVSWHTISEICNYKIWKYA